MNLILQNGYPYPYPEHLSDDEQAVLSHEATDLDNSLTIAGVVHFEWKYTITVEFASHEQAKTAMAQTGWRWWDQGGVILEAASSSKDGYDQSAIITGNKAYCGFILESKS